MPITEQELSQILAGQEFIQYYGVELYSLGDGEATIKIPFPKKIRAARRRSQWPGLYGRRRFGGVAGSFHQNRPRRGDDVGDHRIEHGFLEWGAGRFSLYRKDSKAGAAFDLWYC